MTALASVNRRPHWSGRLSARPLACGALAASLAVVALAVVFLFKIGPVVLVVDHHAGYGIHTGDLWALPLASASLLFVLLGVPQRG